MVSLGSMVDIVLITFSAAVFGAGWWCRGKLDSYRARRLAAKAK